MLPEASEPASGTATARRSFAVTTPGASATRWLSFVLATRPDVFVAHGKHPLRSVVDGDFAAEQATPDDQSSFRDGTRLQVFYDSHDLSQIFDAYRAAMPEAVAHGAVHSFTIEGLLASAPSPEALGMLTVVNLLRHPVSYIASHARLVHNAQQHETTRTHYEDMYRDAKLRFPELHVLRELDEPDFMAFAVSCLSVVNMRADLGEIDCDHIPMETVTRDPDALSALCEQLTGLPYPAADLQGWIDGGAVNPHRKPGSAREPADIYAHWATWQQDIIHLMLPRDVIDHFEASGYDVSMLRLSSSRAANDG